MVQRCRLLVVNLILVATLAGTHWGRSVEGATFSGPDFLKRLPLPFHGWRTTEQSLSKAELDMLQPDSVLARHYAGPKYESADLVVIAGHRKRTVHTPGYCMVGGGWEVISQHAVDVRIGVEIVPAMRSVMGNQGRQMVATYFFTDGTYSTRNVVQLQGISLLKRLKGDYPLQALVRIIVPVTQSQTEAERLSDEFADATVPEVLKALRGTRLVVH